jgi:hypothetical protein
MCGKTEAYQVFTDSLLSATKGLPIVERFSLAEVKLLTQHASSSYIASMKLHQLVFTEEQTARESAAEFFLQTPAMPPPTAAAVDPDSLPPPATEQPPAAEEQPASDEAPPAGPPAAAPPAAEAEAEPPAAEPPLTDAALTDAIAATINAQMAAHQAQMAAEYAAQEQALLDRIGALEAKAAE